MKTSYAIAVTENDAMEGVRGNAHYCAVQVAIERLIPKARRPTIDRQTIRFTIEEDGLRRRLSSLTPLLVQGYIRDFDAGLPFSPFRFLLANPRVATMPDRNPNAAKRVGFGPTVAARTHRLSSRVFGEQSFRVTGQP